MIDVRVLGESRYNSLKLSFIHRLLQSTNAITRGEVIMGTESNKSFLKEENLYHEAIDSTTANDLVVVVDTSNTTLLDEILEKVEEELEQHLLQELPRHIQKNDALSQNEGKSPYFLRDFSSKRVMGRIQSMFKTSFNVLIEDKLLNFSTVGMPLSPHGCVLDKEKIDSILANGKPGELVKLENNVFTFYTRSKILKIDVSKIETVDLKIPKPHLPAHQISKMPLYNDLKGLIFEEKMGLKNVGETQENFERLKHLSEQADEAIEKAVLYLIGRGDGLTPSGDDVLLGFSMIRKAFYPADSFVQLLEEGLKKRNTTAVSMAYYESLFAGYVNRLFLSLIVLATSDEGASTQDLIDLITRYGHTSGYDTLYGFYLGLESLIFERM